MKRFSASSHTASVACGMKDGSPLRLCRDEPLVGDGFGFLEQCRADFRLTRSSTPEASSRSRAASASAADANSTWMKTSFGSSELRRMR